MAFTIQSIDLLVREMPPDRMSFAIGKVPAKKRRPRAVFLVRLVLSDPAGSGQVIGWSGDRPSFGWLDKRPERSPEKKLGALIELIKAAREIYLEQGKSFVGPFQLWQRCHSLVMKHGEETGHESLSSSYASALFERAVIDGYCRAEGLSFFEMLQQEKSGIDPGAIHPELKNFPFARILPTSPRIRFSIRHTVGLNDPITDQDLTERVNDGEPETLVEYVKRDGLRFFKVKISGDLDADLARLEKIWTKALVRANQPVITLDGNEAYTDIGEFSDFVKRFEQELVGLFQHTIFIEQPLTRALTHDAATAPVVAEISGYKPLVIDEADGTLDSFKNAVAIGYAGTSHKNCKGVFKSLLNRALCFHYGDTMDRDVFLTGEDLSNMSIVPLHQDFAVLGALDIKHCERNGHHYGFGLSHLTAKEKEAVARHHPDLYIERNGEWFLNIREGAVLARSIQGKGFGGAALPDRDSLTPLDQWKSWFG